jgi:hypothetical protein
MQKNIPLSAGIFFVLFINQTNFTISLSVGSNSSPALLTALQVALHIHLAGSNQRVAKYWHKTCLRRPNLRLPKMPATRKKKSIARYSNTNSLRVWGHNTNGNWENKPGGHTHTDAPNPKKQPLPFSEQLREHCRHVLLLQRFLCQHFLCLCYFLFVRKYSLLLLLLLIIALRLIISFSFFKKLFYRLINFIDFYIRPQKKCHSLICLTDKKHNLTPNFAQS